MGGCLRGRNSSSCGLEDLDWGAWHNLELGNHDVAKKFQFSSLDSHNFTKRGPKLII